MTRPCTLLPACIGMLAALPAQAPVPRGPELLEITRAADGETVGIARSTQHGMAGTRDGTIYTLVLRSSGGGKETDLELWRCPPGTTKWERITSAPTQGDDVGAIVVDGDLLAIAWAARGKGAWYSTYAQRFDPQKRAWIGEPAVLAAGTGDQDQYTTPDLERTSDGALVCVFGTHRQPVGAWTSPWSAGLCWLAPAATAWSAPVQANAGQYGCAGTLAARGNRVDIVFRTNPDTARLGLRSFDARKFAFATDKDVLTTPQSQEDDWIANTPAFVIDATGACTVLFQAGSNGPGHGRLGLAYAPPGDPASLQFTTTTLCDDPPLLGGNENPQHFALVRGPANQLFAYFAKAGDAYGALWRCAIEDGKPVGEPRRVAEAQPQTFATISGMRSAQSFSTVHVVVAGYPQAHPGGIVQVYGRWPARTVFDAR